MAARSACKAAPPFLAVLAALLALASCESEYGYAFPDVDPDDYKTPGGWLVPEGASTYTLYRCLEANPAFAGGRIEDPGYARVRSGGGATVECVVGSVEAVVRAYYEGRPSHIEVVIRFPSDGGVQLLKTASLVFHMEKSHGAVSLREEAPPFDLVLK